MTLTNTQIRNLAYDHATRVVDSMDYKDIVRYAIDMLADSFDVDLDNILDDMINYAGEDMDEVREHMLASGLTNDEVDSTLEWFDS